MTDGLTGVRCRLTVFARHPAMWQVIATNHDETKMLTLGSFATETAARSFHAAVVDMMTAW